MIELVQQLGEYINDEDPILRGKAVSYLTSVIKALSPRFLSRQQIQVLTTFFCDRIEDGGAVAGLETLQALDRFTKEMAAETAQAYVPSSPVRVNWIHHGLITVIDQANGPWIMLTVVQYLFQFSRPAIPIPVTEVSRLPVAERIDVESPGRYVSHRAPCAPTMYKTHN